MKDKYLKNVGNRGILKVTLLIIFIWLQLFSCSSTETEDLLLGKWYLITDNDSIKATLEFNRLEFKSSSNHSFLSKGKWWLYNSDLFMSYAWLGGKDTLHFDIIKINENELVIYKLDGGRKQFDTLKFFKEYTILESMKRTLPE